MSISLITKTCENCKSEIKCYLVGLYNVTASYMFECPLCHKTNIFCIRGAFVSSFIPKDAVKVKQVK